MPGLRARCKEADLTPKPARIFDKLNRETLKSYSACSDGLTSIVTTFDPNGNPLTVTEHIGGTTRVTTKTYDAFDREDTVTDGFGAQMAYA